MSTIRFDLRTRLLACTGSAALLLAAGSMGGDKTDLVSRNLSGLDVGNAGSYKPSVSGNGRFVAFWSTASDLVAADFNGAPDVFVHDRKTGEMIRASVSSSGAEAALGGKTPSISANGRLVAFASESSDLVDADTNGFFDIFVRDQSTSITTRVSVGPNGTQALGDSLLPAISGNGRYVAFASDAANLVPGDQNGEQDIFVHDLKTGVTTRVSVSNTGVEADASSDLPAISDNGRWVAFMSFAANFESEPSYNRDIFVHDRTKGTTALVSMEDSGFPAGGCLQLAISGNGRHVAFSSTGIAIAGYDPDSHYDVFRRDMKKGFTVAISAFGPGDSHQPSLSRTGRFVAFASAAADLVDGDTNGVYDIFVHDVVKGSTVRASVAADGAQASGDSAYAALSGNGRHVVFQSEADDLVAVDSNAQSDVFVRELK